MALSPNGGQIVFVASGDGPARLLLRSTGGAAAAVTTLGPQQSGPSGAMMAAPAAATGSTLAPGAPVRLFPTRIFGGGVELQQHRQYDMAPDGRFLINTELDSAAAPITLLMNWQPPATK